MKLNLKIITSIINVLKINIMIFKFKLFNNRNKIIFVYHPNKSLRLNHKDYLEDLFNEFGKNYLIIYGHQNNKVNEKNYFFINHGLLLSWIFKVDIFLSSIICDVFTRNTIKVYMHHDIYDTPLVNDKKQKELFDRVIKYDYLFLPNKKSIKMFKNFFIKNNIESNSSLPELLESGYLKLDFLIKKKKTYNNNIKKSIIIAPTNFLAFPDLVFHIYLETLIDKLITNIDSDIIYRPHPSNRDHPDTLKILQKFENSKRFYYDESVDYFENYMKSFCMITDLSGTAYTYAFFTKQPVIFFSKNENLIKKLEYNELSYFKDRNKVGIVVENINEIINNISNIENVTKKTNNSINLLERDMFYISKSKNRIKDLISKLLI